MPKKVQGYENVDKPKPMVVREDLAMVYKIHRITDKGNHAEIKRRTDGSYAVYEVKKNIIE